MDTISNKNCLNNFSSISEYEKSMDSKESERFIRICEKCNNFEYDYHSGILSCNKFKFE